MSQSIEAIEIVITSKEAHQRIDKLLASRDLGVSRACVQRWILEGRVRVDGEPVVSKTKLAAGDTVQIVPAPVQPSEVLPQAIPLDVLFEDSHLLVVNKPAGLVVHPAPGHPQGTLVNALLYHWNVPDAVESPRPGIVHRLDKDTSGVMVVAKNPQVHEKLVEMFQVRDMERRYDAIVVGHLPERSMRIETLYGRHPVDRKRFSSKVSRGKVAITNLEVKRAMHGSSWLGCKLETGRTHQIRVHCADRGCPILGDAVYGKPLRDPVINNAAQLLGRQALHATVLGFAHPITGEPLDFRTELPVSFRQAVALLSADKSG